MRRKFYAFLYKCAECDAFVAVQIVENAQKMRARAVKFCAVIMIKRTAHAIEAIVDALSNAHRNREGNTLVLLVPSRLQEKKALAALLLGM